MGFGDLLVRILSCGKRKVEGVKSVEGVSWTFGLGSSGLDGDIDGVRGGESKVSSARIQVRISLPSP